MDIFDGIPNYLRWILFIPTFFISLFILPYILVFTLGYILDPNMNDNISFLVLTPYQSGVVPGLSLYLSCAMMPRGRIIYASVVLGIFLFLNGMGLSSALYQGMGGPGWRLIYEYFFLLGAYIIVLVSLIRGRNI